MIAPRTDQSVLPIEELQESFGGGQRNRDHPSLLGPNEYYKGVNAEIREGGAFKSRRGNTSRITVSPGSNYQGETYFDPPSAGPFIIQVNDGKFWKWDGSSTTWTRIDTTQLVNTTEPCSLVCVANRVFVFAGSSDNVRSWNGTDVTFTDEGNTNTDPPRGNLAWVQSDRICVAGVDTTSALTNATVYVFFSDINDGQTWDRTTGLKRVPTETGEPVTAGAAYRNEEILTFTRNSTHIFNITGATITNFTRTTIDTRVGCIAHKSVVVIGDDAWFLSADRHVRTIKRTIQDISLGVSVPISYFNEKLMKRIHESNAKLCAGTYFDNYYLLAVPLDGDSEDSDTSTNTKNSHIIPFDNLQQKQGVSGVIPACCGEWDNIPAGGWIVGYFSSLTKLYYINSSNGNLVEMFAGDSDDGTYPELELKMRGFNWQAVSFDKSMHSSEFQLLETFGDIELFYSKDDGTFTSILTATISDTGSRLPATLPFILTAGGILYFLRTRFYRKGRSRYWQFKIEFSNGQLTLKQATLRAFIEMLRLRSLAT